MPRFCTPALQVLGERDRNPRLAWVSAQLTGRARLNTTAAGRPATSGSSRKKRTASPIGAGSEVVTTTVELRLSSRSISLARETPRRTWCAGP